LLGDKTDESGAGKFLSDGEEIIVAHVLDRKTGSWNHKEKLPTLSNVGSFGRSRTGSYARLFRRASYCAEQIIRVATEMAMATRKAAAVKRLANTNPLTKRRYGSMSHTGLKSLACNRTKPAALHLKALKVCFIPSSKGCGNFPHDYATSSHKREGFKPPGSRFAKNALLDRYRCV